jgi:hypothetical protein
MADLSISLQESLRIRDFIYGADRFVNSQATRTAGLMENPLHLLDGPVTARTNPDAVVLPTEGVNVAETLSLRFNPDPITAGPDALHVADQPISADLNPRPVAIASEGLHVADGPPVARTNPDARVLSDAIRIADVATA